MTVLDEWRHGGVSDNEDVCGYRKQTLPPQTVSHNTHAVISCVWQRYLGIAAR
jgi:hypothetical protein